MEGVDAQKRAEELSELAFGMLIAQLDMMHLTELKFIKNCLNGIFEEITVSVDNE